MRGMRLSHANADPATRTVDASVAYTGMWITFIEADYVIRALVEATASSNRLGRCRLSVSNPQLKARLVSALGTKV